MNAGDRVAHYEILGPIGSGGMGEVYLARDTRLGREVALKVLPGDLADDPERLARFRREAKVLASLNHTNIAAIHGLEEEGGQLVLAMELAPGDTLEARQARGAMPVDQVLGVALQMAAGLEEAHGKGIVHRDLKPANVKLGPEGQVKILDFGLARAYAGEETGAGDPDMSPTMTAAMTRDGMILGTAAYMSPEQARGHTVDARTDIWAYGVILWELLAGRRLFAGATVSDTLAAILRAEPEWEALPPDLPPSLLQLLRRCLQRDRRQRLHHIADARIVLEEIQRDGTSAHLSASGMQSIATPSARASRVSRAGWVAAAVLALVVVGLGLQAGHRAPSPLPQPVRFDLTLPEGLRIGSQRQSVAVSPSGDMIIMVLNDKEGRQLYLRTLADPQLKPIAGTRSANTPFFSPDGRSVAFTQDGRLKKVSLEGGTPTDLCQTEWGGGAWTEDGRIIITRSYAGGLDVVPAAGGAVQPLTEPDPASGELGHWWPQVLPGGQWILYTSWNTPIDKARLMAFNPGSGEYRVLVEGGAQGRWVPTGHVVYVRGGKLMAAPFDLAKMKVTGEPEAVLDDVYLNKSDGYSNLAIGGNGTLVYVPASVMSAPSELVWADRDGNITPAGFPLRRYEAPRLSPDGRRLAVTIDDDQGRDIWIHELERGTWSRFTFSASSDFNPTWSADGRTVYYNGEEPQFTIYRRPADGSTEPELLLKEPVDCLPTDASADGRFLVFTRSDVETDSDLWVLPLDGSSPARSLLTTRFAERTGVVSPDSRWLAYVSNETGRDEVYAMRFPDGGARVQISLEGGEEPCWSARGDELFFRSGSAFMSAAVNLKATSPDDVGVGRPRQLFSGSFDVFWVGADYSPTADGKRVLLVRIPEASTPRTLRVVLNWFSELDELGAKAK